MAFVVPTKYWHLLENGKVECDVCPRGCQLQEGQQGMCFVRSRMNDAIVMTSYGRSSGFCIDPIEKKPLNHFLPGSAVLSFGTAGCNLACKYCQNWDISRSREVETLSSQAEPETLAQAAVRCGCRSVAYTYNDPVVFLEYAVDTALACRERGIKNVAVTAGYIQPEPRAEFFAAMDAANIDLKGFSDEFYKRMCAGRLAPVLDALVYVKKETKVWLEITNLLIPGENDSPAEIEAMCAWIVEHLGREVPVHFTAFHPDYKILDHPRTPLATLTMARRIAHEAGIRFAYTGNLYDEAGATTLCAGCGAVLIRREGYVLTEYQLDEWGRCRACGVACPGVFDGAPGEWGAKRMTISLEDYSSPEESKDS